MKCELDWGGKKEWRKLVAEWNEHWKMVVQLVRISLKEINYFIVINNSVLGAPVRILTIDALESECNYFETRLRLEFELDKSAGPGRIKEWWKISAQTHTAFWWTISITDKRKLKWGPDSSSTSSASTEQLINCENERSKKYYRESEFAVDAVNMIVKLLSSSSYGFDDEMTPSANIRWCRCACLPTVVCLYNFASVFVAAVVEFSIVRVQ